MKRLKEFLNRRFAIHCETEEEAIALMNILIKNNIELENVPFYGGNTCYLMTPIGLRHSGEWFFINRKIKIIKFKDLKENNMNSNKGDKNMTKKVKVKIKTLEELLDTEDAVMKNGTISIKGDTAIFTKEMRKFCGKELELEWQPALYFLGSYAVSKWMCSKWKEIDERKDRFNELKEGFTVKGTNYDKRIKIIPNQKDLKYFDKQDNNLLVEIMFADCSTSISLGFDQWDELNNYVNKLKKLKNK